MAHTVRFDALPAGVRAGIFHAAQAEGRNKIDSPNAQMDRKPAEFPLSGLLFPGFIFGPLAVLGLWIYAGGPFAAARYAPVLLTLASLWLFAALAMMALDFYTEHHEKLSDGDYLYAGTVLRLSGHSATIFELAPGSSAKHEVKGYDHHETVYKGGNRYRRTSRKFTSSLVITAIATDGTQLTFRRNAEKLDGAALERLANERFARWHRARAANDHHTMAALDPFAQCYAQRSLETNDPQGPVRTLVPTPVKAALFAAVTSIGLLPAVYALIVSE